LRTPSGTVCRLDKVTLHLALRAMPDFYFCSHDRCGCGQIVEGAEDGSADFFTCVGCGSRSCVRHRGTKWHAGQTCDAYDAALALRVDRGDEAALLAGAVEVKRCPGKGCGLPLSKTDGCDVMACCGRGGDDECRRWTRNHPGSPCAHNPFGDTAHCGQRFCWLCLGPIDADGTRHHARSCTWHEANL
jgi:hypothetical protein